MKNDHTYEYRVFTNRLVDVGPMEVGNCTSKVIENLKSKDKVDGRFFHTSDSNEWFFCWDGKLQQLNLSGDASVNEALKEVEKLIADATVAVEDAKKTAAEAKGAAALAQKAADAATSAVESIENKADKSVVEELLNKVSNKADVSVVEELSKTIEVKADKSVVNEKADKSVVEEISQKVNKIPSVEEIALKSEIPSMDEYITEEKLSGKSFATTEYVGQQIEKIEIPTVPTNVSVFTNDAGYLTEHQDISHLATKAELPTVPTKVSELENDSKFITLSDVPEVAVPTKTSELTNDSGFITINDVPVLEIPEEYITEEELNQKGYLTEHQSLSDYYTKGEINDMIGSINDLIGDATNITNRILNKQ